MSVSQSCSQGIKQNSSRGPGRLLQSFLFFLLFYLYLWLYVDLRLIYHGAGIITNFPVFYKGRAFFMPFLSYPGGPVEYLSAFLSQLFYYSWAGALVVTVQVWLLSVCMDYLLNAAKLSRIRLVCFVLPILLLVIYTRYAYHFDTTIALLVALLFACLYLRITLPGTTTLSSFGAFLFLSVILYYLAGGAFLLFAVVCAIYELIFRFRWKLSLLYVLSAVAVPYIFGLFVFRVSVLDAFCNSLPFSWKILYYEARRREVIIAYLMYLFPPLILVVFGLLQILWKRLYSLKNRAPKKQRKKSSSLPSRIFSQYRHSPKLKWAVESLLLLVIACSVVFFCRNENLRTRFKVDYYAYHKMWPELLMAAQHNPDDPFVAQAVNRALYHIGRLGYDMFTWPQNSDYLILSDKKYRWMYWQIFDVFLDLGVVNMAENALTECLEGLGGRPMVLQRLALVNMVKGNLGSAKIYLGALSKTLFHAGWANNYLNRLESDPDLAGDKYIQHLRSLCLDKDVPIYSLYKEKTLLWLLEKNSQNRMAFEYLMAWYMLNKNLGKLVPNLERLQDFGYRELPTHYEEAAIIYIYGTRKPLNLSGYQPSPQKRQQIEEFTRIINSPRYKGDRQAASEELAKKYRNTYFYYYMYESSGSNK
jgi:hypothetical protein